MDRRGLRANRTRSVRRLNDSAPPTTRGYVLGLDLGLGRLVAARDPSGRGRVRGPCLCPARDPTRAGVAGRCRCGSPSLDLACAYRAAVGVGCAAVGHWRRQAQKEAKAIFEAVVAGSGC